MPGPWTVKIVSQAGASWKHYSVVHDGDYDDVERTEENVRLMAAAPELLAQLMLLHGTNACKMGMGCDVCRAINKAIH